MNRDLYMPSKTKAIVSKYGFRFSKSLGQNFLIDGNIITNICEGAEITQADGIIEIGPGIGTLTQQISLYAKGAEEANLYAIEVGHGNGIGASSILVGESKLSDEIMLKTAKEQLKNTKLGIHIIPGCATINKDLRMALDCGVDIFRVASHCTEADVSKQHIEYARNLGMDSVGFLMMSHMVSPQQLADQAKLMESYGAGCVYMADSGGAMNMNDIRDRMRAFKATLNAETQTGIHAHHNLSLGVANSIVAVEEGCDRIDASLAGMGAGAGNAPLEVFIAAAERLGWNHGTDLYRLMDAADDLVRPLQDRPVRVDRETLALGYAGVYSSFLRHAEVAAEKYGLKAMDILVELGRRRMVGGQEDMIVDVALDLLRQRA